MTTLTVPDGLPYPDPGDYVDPADVPLDMMALANSTQVALAKRLTGAPSGTGGFSYGGGWVAHSPGGYGGLLFVKVGRMVTAQGLAMRSAALNVTDNVVYDVGTITDPAYRPAVDIRTTGPWASTPNGQGRNLSAVQVIVLRDGSFQFVANTTGVMNQNDYIGAGGLTWMTAA